MTVNDKIVECGLFYLGHYNSSCIRVVGRNWSLEIPMNRLREFTNLFPELGWEDGRFINKIKGQLVRVVTDENGYITELIHILDDTIKYKAEEEDYD